MDNNLLYKIAITQIDRIGPILAKNLISYCGGVQEVFQKSKSELIKIPGVSYNLASEIHNSKVFEQAESIIQQVEKNKTKITFYLDDDYPSRLKHFNDSPVLLYHEGTTTYNNYRTIGIVGTRNATIRGKKIVEEIIKGLKVFNVTVISGLAFGVDAIAHKASIENNVTNIAVMGNGIDITYPSQHRNLRNEIIKNGDIITEFPTNTKPDRGHFPMRNRIIASLSDALLVVESDIKGGSMITAKMAFNYNKDVFAIPGRTEDRYSKGTNFLIKSNIAALVENAQDICKIMNWTTSDDKKPVQLELFTELNEKEQLLVDCLKGSELDSLSIDKLMYATELPMGQLSSILLQLEFKGVVESLPGARYMLLNN